MREIQPFLEKVTGFVTRPGSGGLELLLFRHPHAGVQIPAGTVEEGEAVQQAVLREVWEETGLGGLEIVRHIGWRDELPPNTTHVICRGTSVYARPDLESFDWARLPRGIAVRLERQAGDYAQITYTESDRFPKPRYTSYQITGWVPLDALAAANRRHFFHLQAPGSTPDRWEQFSDNHRFALFWAPLSGLPEIVSPQDGWLRFVQDELGYRFK